MSKALDKVLSEHCDFEEMQVVMAPMMRNNGKTAATDQQKMQQIDSTLWLFGAFCSITS